MAQSLIEQHGVTLIEQVVSLLLGSVLITSLYAYFRAELYRTVSVESKTATLEDARGALDIMLRDLMNAGSWASGVAPLETGVADDPDHDADLVCNRVYAASPSAIHIQMDLNGNGNCTDTDPRENIRYELTNPTATCPGPQIIRRNGDCLVANVVPGLPNKLFTYYDANGADLGANPARDAIKRVKIAFSVQVKNPDPSGAGNLGSAVLSSVEFRN
ncbi:MAG: PilW family protein [Candidatus Binatia bacterium]